MGLIERLLSRRRFLGAGLAVSGGAGALLLARAEAAAQTGHGHGAPAPAPARHGQGVAEHPHTAGNRTKGAVDAARNGFDPHAMLTDWETGTVSTLSDGRRLREFEIVAEDREIEIAPGVFFPAWTYNGRVPGPTLRATEGDVIRIRFINGGAHPHTLHFHGIHSARMDGIPGAGEAFPGEEFVYEFTARPFGCHLYHCHSFPLRRHLHKGLYGAFIVDPDPDRHPEHREAAKSRLLGTPENAVWQEMVMVMNGFDTNFDEENEVYAVNSIAFAFHEKPIRIARERPVRVYLVNLTEFDPVNSFHLHGNFFDYYDHGTTLTPSSRTIDTVMQCQAQRGILEFTFKDHEPGSYMFHAHQTEFAELGWMSRFEVA
ncbi:multicopper oxidase domain-containing protein [Shumkonia mesophila]|uniref:multicopper oxidase domain-containing protein n=1 Tax=Shumkonia mesophila TaxID=2838854 RepID=UPI0029349B6D|nr:multicopper oxidase domain-containing protein [Shumkonia mesophila]